MEQELSANAPEQQTANSAPQAQHDPETVNPQTEPPAAQQPPEAQADIEAMIAEAEQRGYLRGRNEAIAETRNEPGLWQIAAAPHQADTVGSARHPVEILREIRPSVWD